MIIGPLVTQFCHLSLGGPVIMTHRVNVGLTFNQCVLFVHKLIAHEGCSISNEKTQENAYSHTCEIFAEQLASLEECVNKHHGMRRHSALCIENS